MITFFTIFPQKTPYQTYVILYNNTSTAGYSEGHDANAAFVRFLLSELNRCLIRERMK